MKKRLLTPLLVISMLFSMTACGNQENTTPPEDQKENISINRPATAYDNSSLDSILISIEADYADSIKFLQDKFEEMVISVGDTYEKYVENKQLLANWYDLVVSEESELFERTIARAVEYMNLITTTIDHDKEGTIDDAMDELYDSVYDNAMDDFYDEVYDDLMDDAYDEYYDGIVEDGYDVDPYEKWSNESREAYENWSDARSNIYDLWSDTRSQLYHYMSCVNSGFYRGNFDVDSIIAEYEKEQAEKETQKEEISTSADTTKDIRPEFQEAMDNYEAFFEEYVEFMSEYASADTDDMIGMLEDYTTYLQKYSETMDSFEELESGDMTTDEALYYAEVSSRIYAKILEIEY